MLYISQSEAEIIIKLLKNIVRSLKDNELKLGDSFSEKLLEGYIEQSISEEMSFLTDGIEALEDSILSYASEALRYVITSSIPKTQLKIPSTIKITVSGKDIEILKLDGYSMSSYLKNLLCIPYLSFFITAFLDRDRPLFSNNSDIYSALIELCDYTSSISLISFVHPHFYEDSEKGFLFPERYSIFQYLLKKSKVLNLLEKLMETSIGSVLFSKLTKMDIGNEESLKRNDKDFQPLKIKSFGKAARDLTVLFSEREKDLDKCGFSYFGKVKYHRISRRIIEENLSNHPQRDIKEMKKVFLIDKEYTKENNIGTLFEIYVYLLLRKIFSERGVDYFISHNTMIKGEEYDVLSLVVKPQRKLILLECKITAEEKDAKRFNKKLDSLKKDLEKVPELGIGGILVTCKEAARRDLICNVKNLSEHLEDMLR